MFDWKTAILADQCLAQFCNTYMCHGTQTGRCQCTKPTSNSHYYSQQHCYSTSLHNNINTTVKQKYYPTWKNGITYYMMYTIYEMFIT